MVYLLLACAPSLVRGLPAAPAPGVLDGVYTDPDGLAARYRMVLPETPFDGLLLFFPWDGADGKYRRAATIRAELAAEHRLAVVSFELPGDGRCWWAPTVQRNAQYIDAFLKDALARYPLDPNRVFTTGLSGGADFAAALFFHTGFRYGGGVVALCGGDVPRLDGGDCDAEIDPPAAPVGPIPAPGPARVRLDFAITGDDTLLPNSRAGAELYRRLGAEVRHRVVPGSGHCGFADGFQALDELREGLAYVDPG